MGIVKNTYYEHKVLPKIQVLVLINLQCVTLVDNVPLVSHPNPINRPQLEAAKDVFWDVFELCQATETALVALLVASIEHTRALLHQARGQYSNSIRASLPHSPCRSTSEGEP